MNVSRMKIVKKRRLTTSRTDDDRYSVTCIRGSEKYTEVFGPIYLQKLSKRKNDIGI